MKALSTIAACLLAASSSAIASAGSAHHLAPQTDSRAAEEIGHIAPSPASKSLPTGFSPREIFRLYRRGQHHTTLYYMPQNWDELGWQREGTFGFISATPFENSRPLYMCQLHNIAWGYFTSGDPGCEGQFLTPFGLIGYISTAPMPGTSPLYRCNYIYKGQLKHFDTQQANCENVPLGSNDGILGYVFR